MQTEGALEPHWLTFLTELDVQLTQPLTLVAMGGFVMNHCYGSPRSTVDLDYCEITPLSQSTMLDHLAGEGSLLWKRHRLYLQSVTVATVPCDHLDRVFTLYTPTLQNLKLLALEAHDLALSKLERSQDRDLYDVQHLARESYLQPKTLLQRYHDEHRLYLLGDLRRYDQTLNLWLNLCWPDQYPA